MSKKTAVYGLLASAVILMGILAFTVRSSSSNDARELQLVHIIVRHGARTPVATFPRDPHYHEDFYPEGWGQLTKEGKLESYETGKFLRERYGEFLGPTYTPKEFYVQSTDKDRVKATLQLINAGLWPPNDLQKWGPLQWQPVPINYQPLNEDTLLLSRKPCPAYSLEMERVFQSEEVQIKLKKLRKLLEYLTKHTGLPIKTFDHIQDLYTTFEAEENYNLRLPDWAKGYYPGLMREPVEFQFKLNNYNPKLVRLKGGVLLKKIVEDWWSKREGSLKPEGRKAFLYGGHDFTIANLLSALKVFEPHMPGYGAAVLLELSFDKLANEYGVEIFYKNSTTAPPHQLQIPGCEKFCPLHQLISLTEENIPKDWAKECAVDDPNYVPPPPKSYINTNIF